MSRSRRHNPYIGRSTTESEKSDKQHNNRRYRQRIKQKLRNFLESIDDLPLYDEVVAKQGKDRIDPQSKWMRK